MRHFLSFFKHGDYYFHEEEHMCQVDYTLLLLCVYLYNLDVSSS